MSHDFIDYGVQRLSSESTFPMTVTMAAMRTILLSCFLFTCGKVLGLSGNFWHITDIHWDPTYKHTENPELVCASSGKRPVPSAGQFGDYLCDAPWDLINSTVYAMKYILPDPDFIVWTGDDTPHVPNEDLGEEEVLSIISNLTHIIKLVFPSTKVYSALGNHDYHLKSQLPPVQNNIYEQTAQLWQGWLEPESQTTFRTGGYYTENLLNRPGYRVVVLNTNLYYDQNKVTENIDDPAGQFNWADQVLTEAANNKEKVYIIGHVPPGFFEKKRNMPWFRPNFNKRYLELIQKHHSLIIGQFFGHHHTDSFRMFYSSEGSPISTMFLTPGVTPWKTTLPGVIDGANNPGIRVFEYDTQTLLVKDMVTYYLNLTHANVAQARWEKEYRFTESFRVPDASPASMHQAVERMASDRCYLQKYYEFNSVNYDLTECNSDCRVDHVCAAREVDFERYEHCLEKERASSTGVAMLSVLSVVISIVWASC
ncbi:acid sphingomyelinase-like phosphodiesterase 3b [Oncorhynchus kisutch]|uniref:Sphingomyelin phosphodiesterase acid like 3B n=1 Tax=Oncorhynchus kisutch TaxID=8019 RepID=A0A8C7GPK1_ONCKI|nr:acid sphingomyelinase-like phosphodiesterase 3b [Oncorhynchus kisutch]XP_031647363.1 acid sphingomyelinase-like phosphodiesterase 3b [Oncorhynchus kisutch]